MEITTPTQVPQRLKASLPKSRPQQAFLRRGRKDIDKMAARSRRIRKKSAGTGVSDRAARTYGRDLISIRAVSLAQPSFLREMPD